MSLCNVPRRVTNRTRGLKIGFSLTDRPLHDPEGRGNGVFTQPRMTVRSLNPSIMLKIKILPPDQFDDLRIRPQGVAGCNPLGRRVDVR